MSDPRVSVERLSGRAKGVEDRNVHYRKGVAGDWRNYFTDEVHQFSDDKAGDLVSSFGSEPAPTVYGQDALS